eukprot:7599560-Karenia_brevis.AAC.1
MRQVMHRIRERQKKDYQLLKEIEKEKWENENMDSDAIYRGLCTKGQPAQRLLLKGSQCTSTQSS